MVDFVIFPYFYNKSDIHEKSLYFRFVLADKKIKKLKENLTNDFIHLYHKSWFQHDIFTKAINYNQIIKICMGEILNSIV